MASEKSLLSGLILSRHHGPGGRRCACPLRVASGAPSKPQAIWDSWKTWPVRQEPGMAPRPPTPCGHVLMPGSLERSQNRVGTRTPSPRKEGVRFSSRQAPGAVRVLRAPTSRALRLAPPAAVCEGRGCPCQPQLQPGLGATPGHTPTPCLRC